MGVGSPLTVSTRTITLPLQTGLVAVAAGLGAEGGGPW